MALPAFLLSKPVMYLAGAAAIAGAIWLYGHSQYRKGYEEMEVKYKQCQLEFKQEADKWNAQVEKQKKDLQEFELKKKGTVKRNWDVFKETKGKVTKNKEKTDASIATNIVPTATVRVPIGFVWVYNSAVEGSRVATGASPSPEVPDYSLRASSETVTFEAVAFTKVIKENVDAYNQVAAQCSKLIDIVVEMEANYGGYIEGSVPPLGDNGGDVLARAVEAQIF